MNKPKKIYAWYLWIAIIFAIIYLSTSIFLLVLPSNINMLIAILFMPIVFFYIILNIVMIIVIFVKQIEKIALYIPGIHFGALILALIVGMYLSFVLSSLDYDTKTIQEQAQNVGVIIGSISQIIIIFVSTYLLKRKNKPTK